MAKRFCVTSENARCTLTRSHVSILRTPEYLPSARDVTADVSTDGGQGSERKSEQCFTAGSHDNREIVF